MKKRVLAALLAALVFTTSAVVSFAETENGAAETSGNLPEDLTTGTQVQAQEEEVDVDADIEDEVSAVIPQVIEEVKVGTADEFLDVVDKCKLDTWSANKRIVLTDDISLVGKDFNGIPSFAGIFDGQGHTISEVNIRKGLSYIGFFTHVEKNAVIMNLNVTGSIIPEDSNASIVGGLCGENSGYINECSFKGVVKGKDYVGGIVGINNLSGDIRFNTAEGYISGIHFVGGVAGKNEGNIANCRNEASVNTTNTDTEIAIDSMEKLNTVLNLFKNGVDQEDDEASADTTVTDVGGIAGVSIGIIARCINNGEIGYDHVGYNVGGIAGRQSGYLYNCSNNGSVKGRKDIGGIVGQAEPYITVDFATDIAYQLSEAVAQLHDTVAATLNDTKNQSDVLTARLAIIQQFTGAAVQDAKYLAEGAVDYANGVSAATTETIARVDYVLEESSKDGGPLDNYAQAATNVKSSTENAQKAVNDLNIEEYLTGDELEQYQKAREGLLTAFEIYEQNYTKSYRVYYNSYVEEERNDLSNREDCGDIKYYNVNDVEVTWQTDRTPSDSEVKAYIENGDGPATEGKWKHDDGTAFPRSESDKESQLNQDAMEHASKKASKYAVDKDIYYNPVTGSNDYEQDLITQSQVLATIYANHVPEMREQTRKDAGAAINDLNAAAANIETATYQTKDIFNDVSGREDIVYPQFSDEYKAHTTSLADNLDNMNENFGLLNQEMNGATGVVCDDLAAVNDQFNNILNLYTDALDGVLEKDYTNIFNDDSLADAEKTTDATVDSCFNFGSVVGDIDISGIAGTMAIEYDYDKESDITGLKDSGINGSYLTKCVLRGNRNYGDIRSLKDYAGGICGRQDMGTILNCGSYAMVEATDGNYVGGVAGGSISYIVECYSKGEMEGLSYVGGIAGDGKHVRDCLTIVGIDENTDWSGAIAGHISEGGEVRNNYFVSDNLAGVDRVSYSLKAEPISYSDVINNTVFKENKTTTEADQQKSEEELKVVSLSSDNSTDASENTVADPIENPSYRSLPGEFSKLTVNFVLEDEDLDGGKERIARISKNYGEALTAEDYPVVENRDGFYADWDIDGVDSLTRDLTVTATYKRYKTTIAESSISEDVYQSELLVDGLFHEEDKLEVEKTVYATDEEVAAHLDNYEVLKVTIPDDGQSTHQIRFKAINRYADLASVMGGLFGGTPTLYLGEGDNRVALEKTGTVGKYSTYEVEGNDLVLSVSIRGAKNAAWTIVIGAAVLLLILIIIILIIMNGVRKRGGQIPGLFSTILDKVTTKIENKEQIFYDDSKDMAVKGDKSDKDRTPSKSPKKKSKKKPYNKRKNFDDIIDLDSED